MHIPGRSLECACEAALSARLSPSLELLAVALPPPRRRARVCSASFVLCTAVSRDPPGQTQQH